MIIYHLPLSNFTFRNLLCKLTFPKGFPPLIHEQNLHKPCNTLSPSAGKAANISNAVTGPTPATPVV